MRDLAEYEKQRARPDSHTPRRQLEEALIQQKLKKMPEQKIIRCRSGRGVLLMNMGQDFRRMTDKARKPTEEEMVGFIGERAKEAWLEIRRFLEDRYDLVPETVFYGAKYGWTIRYRKGGKTLCSLFPEKGGFTVLIVLGRKES